MVGIRRIRMDQQPPVLAHTATRTRTRPARVTPAAPTLRCSGRRPGRRQHPVRAGTAAVRSTGRAKDEIHPTRPPPRHRLRTAVPAIGRKGRGPRVAPPSTRTSTASRLPAMRSAPASASPARPPPNCSTDSARPGPPSRSRTRRLAFAASTGSELPAGARFRPLVSDAWGSATGNAATTEVNNANNSTPDPLSVNVPGDRGVAWQAPPGTRSPSHPERPPRAARPQSFDAPLAGRPGPASSRMACPQPQHVPGVDLPCTSYGPEPVPALTARPAQS